MLRQANEDFYKSQVRGNGDTRWDHTPYIVFRKDGSVHVYSYLNDLLEADETDSTIIKSWGGQWSSDVFQTTYQDLSNEVNKE